MSNSVPNSVLEAALLAEAPKQLERFQRNKLKRHKGKVKWQREIDEINSSVADAVGYTADIVSNAEAQAEKLRQQYDPELMRINANLDRKVGVTLGLQCPKCHESDKENKVNGKPWCIKCNVALESPFLVKKHFPDIKVLPKTKRSDVTFRRLDE